jgi:hypothetical protein
MCFNLSYAEAIEWRSLGLNLIGDAEQRASKMEVDPLLRGADDVSRLVSAVDSIKKRHGTLIEYALISAINWVPGWHAEHQAEVKFGGKTFKLDCFAHHSADGKLYVFECKRGHGVGDKDALRSIDDRLTKVTPASEQRARDIGLNVRTIETLILSFYGKKWKSNYPVVDRREAAALFPRAPLPLQPSFVVTPRMWCRAIMRRGAHQSPSCWTRRCLTNSTS